MTMKSVKRWKPLRCVSCIAKWNLKLMIDIHWKVHMIKRAFFHRFIIWTYKYMPSINCEWNSIYEKKIILKFLGGNDNCIKFRKIYGASSVWKHRSISCTKPLSSFNDKIRYLETVLQLLWFHKQQSKMTNSFGCLKPYFFMSNVVHSWYTLKLCFYWKISQTTTDRRYGRKKS